MSVHKSAQSNKADTNDIAAYDELIAIFDSVNLRAKPREEILAWHHKQVAQETNKAVITELKRLPRNPNKSWPEIIDERIRALTADKEEA